MASNTTSIRPTRGRLRRANVLGIGHPSRTVVDGGLTGGHHHTLVLCPGTASAAAPTSGLLGSAPIQKPPRGNLYCAGEFARRSTPARRCNTAGAERGGQYDKGLRWKYA